MSFDARWTVIDKFVAYDFETITVNTAIGLTSAKLTTTPRPKKVSIDVETAQLRYRIDGVANPTSAVGIILNPMDRIDIEGIKNMEQFKAIKTGTTNSKLQVTFYR